jgi:molybdopterin converting factor subunit 1
LTRVLFFGAAADLAGGAREVELEAGSTTLAELWGALVERYPDLAPMRDSLAFAVNGEYATMDDRVEEGDEVAVLPPVSGG